MQPNETDEEIITRFQQGDQQAFKDLIDRYVTPLYNFTARIAGRNDASDIVQEIFIKVWKNIGRFNPIKASFKTWIFTISKNTATDFLRKKRSLLFSDIADRAGGEKDTEDDTNFFADNIPDEQILPDVALEKLQEKKFLNNLLDQLKPDYREVLVLHYQEEMTFDEIGRILNKPLNTVKSQHRRAIIELRKKATRS